MVFESVLVDVLNKYLKPYVKKLDTSQLKIGVWKGKRVCPSLPLILSLLLGNVSLGKLELKENLFVREKLIKIIIIMIVAPPLLPLPPPVLPWLPLLFIPQDEFDLPLAIRCSHIGTSSSNLFIHFLFILTHSLTHSSQVV